MAKRKKSKNYVKLGEIKVDDKGNVMSCINNILYLPSLFQMIELCPLCWYVPIFAFSMFMLTKQFSDETLNIAEILFDITNNDALCIEYIYMIFFKFLLN